jgi:hypothetical protein
MKKIYLMSLLITVLLVGGCSIGKKDSSPININNNIKKDSIDIKTFDGQVKEFNEVYKKALFATGKEKKEESKKNMSMSLSLWQKVVDNFKEQQPNEYKSTLDWGGSLDEILALEKSADKLVKEEKFQEAHEELEVVRKKLKELRQDNNVKNISDDMLIFHDIMEEVIEIESLDKAKGHFDELVLSFSELRKYAFGSKYEEKLKKLEKALMDIVGSSKDDFKENRDKIKPLFIDIYLVFG